MKTVRRIVSILLTLILACGCMITCYAADDAATKDYKGTFAAGSGVDNDLIRFDFDLKLNYDWFVYGDNTVYYTELAKVAAAASSAIYGDFLGTEGELAEGKISGNSLNFLADIGFEDGQMISVASENGFDEYDGTRFMAGHKKVAREGRNYEIVFVSVMGSWAMTDWVSNFDVGADTDAYYELTGEHPEWRAGQKQMHKGFAVTANRAKSAIDEYVAANTAVDAEKIIMLTGHSRGASVANILGTFYEEETANYLKSFTYTFAPAATTTATEKECARYKTIFNVVNTDDLVPTLPSGGWGGFKLYGTTLRASGADYTELFRKVTGREYTTFNGQDLGAVLGSLTDTREGLYEFDYSEMGLVDKGISLSKSRAQKRYDNIREQFEEDGNLGYIDLKLDTIEKNDTTQYHVYFNYRPAYALNLFSELITNDKILSGLAKIVNYPLSASYYKILSNLVEPVLNKSLISAHMPNIYYCIATDDFGYDQDAFMQHGSRFGDFLGSVWFWVIIGAVILAAVLIGFFLHKKKQNEGSAAKEFQDVTPRKAPIEPEETMITKEE